MPRVLYNSSIQGFSGRLGNLIFRTLPDGTTIVSAAPAEKTRREKKRLKRPAADEGGGEGQLAARLACGPCPFLCAGKRPRGRRRGGRRRGDRAAGRPPW